MKLKQSCIAIVVSSLFGSYVSRKGLLLGALSAEIDATAHGKLPEGQRAWYVKDGDKFKLDLAKVDIEDTGSLKSALEKEREAVKAARKEGKSALEALAAKYKDIDPEKYKAIMAQFEDAEEAEMLKQGAAGIKAIIEKRTEKLRADFEKERKKLIEEKDGALQVATTFMERVLDNHVRESATKAGVHPGAVDDVLLRARSMFSLDDDANPVQYQENSEDIVLGKDGKTPFNPSEWLEDMKEKAPHWFPANASGGGAGGDRGANKGAKTMKRAAFDALDPLAKATAVRDKTVVID